MNGWSLPRPLIYNNFTMPKGKGASGGGKGGAKSKGGGAGKWLPWIHNDLYFYTLRGISRIFWR